MCVRELGRVWERALSDSRSEFGVEGFRFFY